MDPSVTADAEEMPDGEPSSGTNPAQIPAATDPDAGRGAVDLLGFAQLWTDQFRHLTTLGLAGAGGVLVLLETQVMRASDRWWLALGLFAMTAVLSMYGQIRIVDDASVGRMPGAHARRLRGLALSCLGAAGGAVFSILLRG